MEQAPMSSAERGARWASTVALFALVVLQAPGRIVPETKFDVTVDPIAYLGRALGAWDPSASFGRVQNQAVGYLFPMGAFSAAGRAVGLPPWLVQRLWIGLVLSVALWGAHRVARALGVATVGGRLAAGWAYALAPATLATAAFQSAGQLPYAVAPHVLVPLLAAREGASPRRVAAASTLWIVAMGGVNGASAIAVLPLVGWWLLTRSPGPDRRRLVAWWCGGAVAATLWWALPLLVSIRYGIRFTDFTETAALTTITESGTEVLRGTGNWLSFIRTPAGMWLPGGWLLAASRLAIVGTIVVAAAGLVGLSRRDAPGRSWLLLSLVSGVVVMGIGYGGAGGGPLAEVARDVLDGPLAPLRNVHKFAAVVRLPLAIGFGHLVAVATIGLVRRRDERPSAPRWLPLAAPAVALAAVVVAIAPAAGGSLTAPGSFREVPGAWSEAARWLDEHGGDDRTLLVPASGFAEYEWGRPLDEPLGTELDGPWAVRDLIPLGGEGSTRVLDGIEAGLSREALPVGFTSTLQRAGIRYLLVRNDLDLGRTGAPRPATVRRLLSTAPGLERVASFGPVRTDLGVDRRLAAAPGAAADDEFRTLDVWEVPDPAGRVTAYPLDATAVVSGGPEALLAIEPDLVDGRATVLAVDEPPAGLRDPLRIATDTARRRDVEFGAIHNNATYALAADEPSPATGRAPRDRWPAGAPDGLTTARVDGAATLRESPSRNRYRNPEWQPYAALDANPATTWVPAGEEVGGWLEVGFDEPRALGPEVRVALPRPDGRRIAALELTTDQGSQIIELDADGTATAPLPEGPTRRLRIEVAELTGSPRLGPVGLASIEVDGLELRRPLDVPSPGGDGARVVVLERARRDLFSITRHDEDGELDRRFAWAGGPADVSGTALAVPGPRLAELVAVDDGEGAVRASASSTLNDLPAFAAWNVVDGDPTTGWVSEDEAGSPTLRLDWDGALPVDSVVLRPLDAGLDPIGEVEVVAGGATTRVALDGSGRLQFPAVTTDHLELRFPGDPETDATERLGRQVAVAEVEVPALLGRRGATPDRDAEVQLGCGEGPPVELDGESLATTARTTVGELIDGVPVAWRACDAAELDEGTHRLRALPGALLASTAVVAPEDGVEPAGPGREVTVERWDREHRRISVGAGDAAVLATTENLNDGWEATVAGERLEPVQVDGWRQGWVLPAGDEVTVTLTYGPGRSQRLGLAVGLAAVLALVAAATVATRRSRASRWAPPAERAVAPWVAVVGAVVAGVALAGPVAMVVLPLALVPWCRRHLGAIAAGALAAAGVVAFVQAGAFADTDRGTFSLAAQVLAATSVVAVALSLRWAGAGSTRSSRGRGDRRPSGTDTTPEGSG